MVSSTHEKVRENRLRRMAERQGLRLVKSRRRDPRALDFGVCWLEDGEGREIRFASNCGEKPYGYRDYLDAIEQYLTGAPATENERVE